MPHVDSAVKAHVVKSSHPQAGRNAQPADGGRNAFESLLDDNAANAKAAAKDSSQVGQAAAPDRTQRGQAPKDKADNGQAGSKPADTQQAASNQPPADNTPPVNAGSDTLQAGDTPVVVSKPAAADISLPPEPSGDAKADDVGTATDMPVAATVANPVPAVPVQTVTPADAPPAQPDKTPEATAQTPAIAAVKAQQPVEAAVQAGKPAEEKKADKADTTKQSATAEQTVDATETAPQQADQQASADKTKHVPLTEADKEHIARARGETGDKTDVSGRIKTDQTDAGSAVQKPAGDAPTPQVQTASPATHQTPSTTAAAAALQSAPTPAPTPVPVAGVAVAIASKAAGGERAFEIRLDPPELGRIEVRLSVDRDGNVTSRLIADRQDTLDLLRRDSAGLERALQDAGLKTSDNGLQFSLRDQSFAQQQQNNGNGNGNGNLNTTRVVMPDDALPTIDVPVQSYGRLTGRTSGLDIRV